MEMVKEKRFSSYKPAGNPQEAFGSESAGPVEAFNKLFHHENGEEKKVYEIQS